MKHHQEKPLTKLLNQKTFRDSSNQNIQNKNTTGFTPATELIFQQITRNIQTFLASYQKFLQNPKFRIINQKIFSQIDYLNTHIYHISELYHFILSNCSYYETIALGKFHEFASSTGFFTSGEEARKCADRYLFHFMEIERIEKHESGIQKDKHIREISEFDPSLIQEIPIFVISDMSNAERIIMSAYKRPLSIIRGLLSVIELNNLFFREEYLLANFPLMEIEVIEQPVDYLGFNSTIIKQVWTIRDYLSYLNNKKNRSIFHKAEIISPDSKKIKSNKVYFGANIDMDEMLEPREELRTKLPPLLAPFSFHDGLSYIREQIKGMTIPQFFIKEEGVWIGGHEENNRLSSININHESKSMAGDSEWYGIAGEDTQEFISYVEKKHNVNIFTKEGLWFQDINYFIKNKIKFYYGIQKPGDILLTGVGSLTWAKSRGFSVNSSWNFCVKEHDTFKSCMKRNKINRKLGMRSLMPIHTLMLDLMNFEMLYLDESLVEYCYNNLKCEITRTNTELNTVLSNKEFYKISPNFDSDYFRVVMCELCNIELFNGWALCSHCSKNSKESANGLIMCLTCLESHVNLCKKQENLNIFYKYYPEDLEKLLARCDRRINKNSKKEDAEVQLQLTKINCDTIQMCKFKSEYIKNLQSHDSHSHLLHLQQIFEQVTKTPMNSLRNIIHHTPTTTAHQTIFQNVVSSKAFITFLQKQAKIQINGDYNDYAHSFTNEKKDTMMTIMKEAPREENNKSGEIQNPSPVICEKLKLLYDFNLETAFKINITDTIANNLCPKLNSLHEEINSYDKSPTKEEISNWLFEISSRVDDLLETKAISAEKENGEYYYNYIHYLEEHPSTSISLDMKKTLKFLGAKIRKLCKLKKKI